MHYKTANLALTRLARALMNIDGKRKNIPVSKYRQVDISDLKTGRRGKHHDLVQGIVEELVTLQSGSALEIPLAEVGGVGLANLRSAVHRAATSQGLQIETVADEGNFYVWKANR